MNGHVRSQERVQRRRASVPWLTIFFFVVLFVVVGGDYHFSLRMADFSWREETAGLVEHGSLKHRLMFLILGIYGVVGLRKYGRKELRLQGPAAWLITAYVGLAFLSFFWSGDVDLTARRLFVFGALCTAALALASRCSVRDPILLAFSCGGTALLLGVAAEMSLGTMSPQVPGYRFAGLGHPNATGLMAGVFVLACTVAADSIRLWRRLFQVCAVIGFVLLVLTKSRTAFVSALIGVVVYKNLVSRFSKKVQVIFTMGILFLVFLTIFGSEMFPVLEEGILLGRAQEKVETLTGRVGLWGECLKFISRKPLIGYGYSSFWTPDRIEEISYSQGWGISSSHSIYLESALNLGLLGLFLFLGFMWPTVKRSWRAAQRTGEPAYAFLCGLFVLFLTHGVLDSTTMNPGFPSFLIMTGLAEIWFVARGNRSAVGRGTRKLARA
jgi:O-antigen ligase